MNVEVKSIVVKAIVDENPPLDYLGKYSNDPGPEGKTIDRQERGDLGRGQKRYFIAESDGAADELYERMEKFQHGHLTTHGIVATAAVSVGGTVQTIESGGLWGIDSDVDEDYANEAACEELDELYIILKNLTVDIPDGVTPEWADGAPWSGNVE